IVPFVAGVDALATALASADAFVHAGDQETFGLSALEALACGTPIVVRAAEGLGELVDGGTGIAVDGGNGAAFAQGIAALFDRDRPAMRRAARARAEASDWNRVMPELLNHYRRLLGRDAPLSPAAADSMAMAAHR
ncbi:MAG: glycosyltransferase, partial [Pseudomonadota bacterium]|nr:glycosyltransferase [Pseudomonadota bacterium]